MEQRIFPCTSAVLALVSLVSCGDVGGTSADRKVHSATLDAADLPTVDVKDPQKFLNDLKLSPLWKVERARGGAYSATARSASSANAFPAPSPNRFLFEYLADETPGPPMKCTIHNTGLRGTVRFSTLSAVIEFRRPTGGNVTFHERGKATSLAVYDSREKTLGLNSYSRLAVRLSGEHEIYLILREQGDNKKREETVARLPVVLKSLAALAALPPTYRVKVQYKRFFSVFFPGPEQAQVLKRFPGLQDRDTFCGYFKAKPQVSYEGVNIKISHPTYCSGECTRASSRLAKAEYLGSAYFDGDLLFFLIEDNAVYLDDPYNKNFGTFTGTGSFKGTLEVLNGSGDVLHTTVDNFKGWER